MNIGFVSTWLERGAMYVTKNYMDMLKDDNDLFVFARGGEYLDKNVIYQDAKITYGYRLQGTKINWKQMKKWIRNNKLDLIIFNEQSSMDCVYLIRKEFPDVLVGSYIDYYTENTICDFSYYHFLLCNTKRHYSAFSWHNGAYYLPWGCNIDTFEMAKRSESHEIVFFHSMGMSPRKGTDVLIQAFLDGDFVNKGAKLIIHTQCSIKHLISEEIAKKNNIKIINRVVPHPGLYYLGDVYVYPTTLDGLGLTIYEALASGLPVITTDEAPMNEIISVEKGNGKLVSVKSYHCRKDAYYWPLSFVDKESLISAMDYYCNNRDKIEEYRMAARKYAERDLDLCNTAVALKEILNDISNRKDELNKNTKELVKPVDHKYDEAKKILFNRFLPDFISDKIRTNREKKRFLIK